MLWRDEEETLVYIVKWKKPMWKGSVLCDPSYMTFLKGKTMRRVKRPVAARGLGGRTEGWIGGMGDF